MEPQQFEISTLLQTKSSKNSWEDQTNHFGWYVLAHDIENKGDFPEKKNLLLSAFCNNDDFGNEEVLVIDNTSVDNMEIFTPEILKRCLFIAHNADHEATWGHATGFLPERFACTMVNSKRLLSGQQGFRHDLVSEINRWLGYEYIPIWTDKDIRSEFKDIEHFIDYHILYNAADTIRLKHVYYKQRERAKLQNQLYLLNTINSRIILPIAEAEMRGIKHDGEKWNSIARERQSKANAICQKLDTVIKDQYGLDAKTVNPVLRKKLEVQERKSKREKTRLEKLESQKLNLEQKGKTHLKSYQITLSQLEKLKSSTPELDETAIGSINWGSPKQVIEVFNQIGCPLPMAKDKKTHQMKAGMGKEARTNWFVNNPESPYLPLITSFDEYKKIVHNVTSFGEKWVEQYTNPLTGRVHTKLDQAGTDTGRFSSGSKGNAKNKKYPNMQQIPKFVDKNVLDEDGKAVAVYRSCFVADPGRSMITLDYSNCEGNLMIALSGDLNMKKIADLPDSHSYLGTKCWKNIYDYRYKKTGDPKWKELSENYVMNKSTPEKEKERDIFKNSGGLFPVAYGVAAAKVAATSKITNEEGQVMIDTIKGEIPLVIKFLDSKSAEAVKNGYVVHNTRTGSRRWFDSILNHLHYGWPLSKSEIAEVEFAARNSPIQGGNSDLMKEAIAMIALWAKLFKQDIRFLLTVHDEYVCDVPTDQAEFLGNKIMQLMQRAAQNYLIKEINMGVDMRIAQYWKK